MHPGRSGLLFTLLAHGETLSSGRSLFPRSRAPRTGRPGREGSEVDSHQPQRPGTVRLRVAALFDRPELARVPQRAGGERHSPRIRPEEAGDAAEAISDDATHRSMA